MTATATRKKAAAKPPPPAKARAAKARAAGAKQTKKKAATAKRKARSAAPARPKTDNAAMTTWYAQYIYAEGTGRAAVQILTIHARSRDAALAVAQRSAPAEEFVLSLHPQSDEQFLGRVRLQAMAALHRD